MDEHTLSQIILSNQNKMFDHLVKIIATEKARQKTVTNARDPLIQRVSRKDFEIASHRF